MKRNKSQKGITLVALIITIIVLLILAVATIQEITGDGIIQKAINATENHKKEQAVESVMLALNEWKLEKHLGSKTFEQFLQEKFGATNVTNNGDETFTLKVDGYSFIVDENGILSASKIGADGYVTLNGKSLGTTAIEIDGLLYTITNYEAKTAALYGVFPEYRDEDGNITLDKEEITIAARVNINGAEYTVTVINDYAFSEMETLKKVVIPNTVTRIGMSAFSGCQYLEDVTLSNNLKSIDGSAFSSCESLTEIVLPNSITSIGNSAFAYSGVVNVTTSGTCSSLVGSGTGIGSVAFRECSSLKTIAIPEGITVIGNSAFSECEELTTITMSDNVTVIGSNAFRECSNVEIQLPKSLKYIGSEAFYYCKSITGTSILKDVISIGEDAFRYIDIDNIENAGELFARFTGDIGFSAYDYVDWEADEVINGMSIDKGILYSTDSDIVKGDVVIPEGVIYIDEYAFGDNTQITSVTIPSSVKGIGSEAFYGCTALTNVTIEEGLIGIDENAFEDCLNLANITIPSTIEKIGKNAFAGTELLNAAKKDGLLIIGNTLIDGTEAEKDLDIPGGVICIADNAFGDDEEGASITSVNIPDTVKHIGKGAFENCSSLSNVKLPKDLTKIEDRVFANTAITNISIPETATSIGDLAYSNCKNLTEIIIPDTIINIGAGAFYDCSNVEKLEIPTSVKLINTYEYPLLGEESEKLKEITISNAVMQYIAADGGSNFLSNVENFTLLEDITYWSYWENRSEELKEIYILGDFLSIGVVRGTPKLTKIELPDTMLMVDAAGFRECDSLQSITLPNYLVSIGRLDGSDAPFTDCSSMKEIVIPDTVLFIDSGAFGYCELLENVTMSKNIYSIGEGAFEDTIWGNEQYQNGIWVSNNKIVLCDRDYVGEIDIPAGVTSIGTSFYNCTGITKVTIPNTVSNIDSLAFYNCTSLASVIIPDSITSIGSSAFNNCTSLTSIIIPDSVTSIGSSAFYNCTSLTSVVLPSNITKIEHSMFNNCTSLNSITIPDKVTLIESSVFYNCESLNNLIIPNTVETIYTNAFYNVPHVTYNGAATGSPWGALSIN